MLNLSEVTVINLSTLENQVYSLKRVIYGQIV